MKSPLAEAISSAAAWLIIGIGWYVFQCVMVSQLFLTVEFALQTAAKVLIVMLAAFILRYITTFLFRSSGAYYVVDLGVWVALAVILMFLTGWGPIDPQGTLVFFAFWMFFPGSLLVLLAVTTSIILSAVFEKVRKRSGTATVPTHNQDSA